METCMRTRSQKLTIPAEWAKSLHFDGDVLQHVA